MEIAKIPRIIRRYLKQPSWLIRSLPANPPKLDKVIRYRIVDDKDILYIQFKSQGIWFTPKFDDIIISCKVPRIVSVLRDKRRNQVEDAMHKWIKDWAKDNKIILMDDE